MPRASRVRWLFGAIAFALTLALGAHPARAQAPTPGFPQFPSVSADGSLVVVSWAGDLWCVRSSGGVATRLTAHPAYEGRSAFSPSGDTLAFESDRDGARNLYVMDLVRTDGGVVGGPVRRVTVSDQAQTLGGFTNDGRSLLYSDRRERQIYRQSRMYRAPLDGGPVERITDAFGYQPHATPDGGIVFTRGFTSIWTRPKYRGPGAMNVWRMAPDGTFTQVTTSPANDGQAFVRPDGSTVFVSSRSGQNNLWMLRAGELDLPRRKDRTETWSVPTQLTSFEPTAQEVTIGHGVRDLWVSHDGSTAVFCVWDTTYTLDLNTPGSSARAIDIRVSADTDSLDFERIDLDNEVDEAAISPDGKSVAVVARGEIFVRSTEDDRPTRRVTTSHARERDIAWSPDGRALYYATDESGRYAIHEALVTLSRDDLKKDEPEEEGEETDEGEESDDESNGDGEPDDGENGDDDADDDEKKDDEKKDDGPTPGERWAEALRFESKIVASDPDGLRSPVPSPDGGQLLAVRGRGDIVLIDLETGAVRELLGHWSSPSGLIWAGDSRHILYSIEDMDHNSDIWLMDTQDASKKPVNITRHPDSDVDPHLSVDGKFLVFRSDRAGNNWEYDVWGVYLDKELEGKRPYELEAHFEEAAKAAKKRKPIDPVLFGDEANADDEEDDKQADEEPEPLEFDTDDAYLRLRRITNLPGSEGNLAMTPGGNRIIFQARIDGDTALYSVEYDGDERKTIASSGVSDVRVGLKGERVGYVRSNRARSAKVAGGDEKTYAIDATVEIEISEQQRQKFTEAARLLGDGFYHPTLKGLDWAGLTDRYRELAVGTRTSSGFNRIGNMLFGELDGSHLGIWGGDSYSAPSPNNGYLGVEASPVAGGYRVDSVIPQSPADQEASRLSVGDVILAVGDTRLAPNDGAQPTVGLHAALAGTRGKETLLEVRRADAAENEFVLITPESQGRETILRYEDEVRQRRELVDRLSNGRIGYLHIRGMSEPSVRDFERDLYAAAHDKDALLIDVRDNGGGWTTDILLSSLTAPNHAYTVPRGAEWEDPDTEAYPRDRRLIYAYQRPISVLMNENSFSNAEIFSHAIKTTGRGKLVGTQTFGGVISTGGTRLIDGTFVRMPYRGWYLPDGTDMENNGAVPDIDVRITPADEAAGRDPQLEAAVEELLERAGS